MTPDSVIERTEADVFSSVRTHSPAWRRIRCSVTRTFRRRTSSRARRSPITSHQRIPLSTAS